MTEIIYMLFIFEHNNEISECKNSIVLKIINVCTKNIAVLSANGYGREK